MPVSELVQRARHEQRHFYKWRAKYGVMHTYMFSRLKELEAENAYPSLHDRYKMNKTLA